MAACSECLVLRHTACSFVSVADEQPADEEGYVSVDYYCCCGHEWTSQRLTLETEYAAYAEELRQQGYYAQGGGSGG